MKLFSLRIKRPKRAASGHDSRELPSHHHFRAAPNLSERNVMNKSIRANNMIVVRVQALAQKTLRSSARFEHLLIRSETALLVACCTLLSDIYRSLMAVSSAFVLQQTLPPGQHHPRQRIIASGSISTCTISTS